MYQQIAGKKLPDEQQAEMFHGKMAISSDKIHYTVELPGFDVTFSYKLHPDEDPQGLDLTITRTTDEKGVGVMLLGIYRIRDGTLEICYNKTTRPTAFSADEGSNNTLIILKRVSGSK